MSLARALRESWRTVASVAFVELATSWIASVVLVRWWTAVIRPQPSGAASLFAHGGRGAIDLLRDHPDRAMGALQRLGVCVAGYSLIAVVLGAALAAGLCGSRDRVGTAWRRALASWRGATALAGLASVGYLIATGLGVAMARLAWVATADFVNSRSGDLIVILSIVPSVGIVYAIRVWHDVALVECIAAPTTALTAARSALRRIRSVPRPTLGAYALTLAASSVLLAIVALVKPRSPGASLDAALAAAVALRQLCAFMRIVVRAAWIAHLTVPWRANSATPRSLESHGVGGAELARG